MKKKLLCMALLVVSALYLSGCGKAKREEAAPKIAYIEDELYYATEDICETVPRRMPDGFIETFVPAEIMPDAYNSANFGAEQGKIEFMFLEDGQLIVHIDENWYYFTKAE